MQPAPQGSPTAHARALALQGRVDALASFLAASEPAAVRLLDALDGVLETVPPKLYEVLLPSGTEHQAWYMDRARRIDAISGFLDYTRDLLEIGAQKTKAGPESPLGSLLVQTTHLMRLVYECGFDEGLTLERWEKMSPLERLQVCASNAGPNEVSALLTERYLPMYSHAPPDKAAPFFKAIRDYCLLRIDEHGGVDLCRAILTSPCAFHRNRADGRLLFISTAVAAFQASKRFSSSVCAQYEALFSAVPPIDGDDLEFLGDLQAELQQARLALEECTLLLTTMKICERWGRKFTPRKLKSLSPSERESLVDSLLLHGQRRCRNMTPPTSPGSGGEWSDESWMRLLHDVVQICDCLSVDVSWAKARAVTHMLLGSRFALARGLLENSPLYRDAVGDAVVELFTSAGDASMLQSCEECIASLPAEIVAGSDKVRRVQGMMRALETLSACGVDDVVPLAVHQAVEAGRVVGFLERVVAQHPSVYASQDSTLGRPGARLMRIAAHLGVSNVAAQRLVVLAALDAGDVDNALSVGERALASSGSGEDAWRVADALRDYSVEMRAQALARCPDEEIFVASGDASSPEALDRAIEAGLADFGRRPVLLIAAIAQRIGSMGSLQRLYEVSSNHREADALILRGMLGCADADWVLFPARELSTLPQNLPATLAPLAQELLARVQQSQGGAKSLMETSFSNSGDSAEVSFSSTKLTEGEWTEAADAVIEALIKDLEPPSSAADFVARSTAMKERWIALVARHWDSIPWSRLGQALSMVESEGIMAAKAETLVWLSSAHPSLRAVVGRLSGADDDGSFRFLPAECSHAEAVDLCAQVAPSLAGTDLPAAVKRLAAACEVEPKVRPSELLEAVVERQLGLFDAPALVPSAFAAKRYQTRLKLLVAKLVPSDAAHLADSLAFRGAGRLALETRLLIAKDALLRCSKDVQYDAECRRAVARLEALCALEDLDLASKAEEMGADADVFLALKVDAQKLQPFLNPARDLSSVLVAALDAEARIGGDEAVVASLHALQGKGQLSSVSDYLKAGTWSPLVSQVLAELGVLDSKAVVMAEVRQVAETVGWSWTDTSRMTIETLASDVAARVCDARTAEVAARILKLLNVSQGTLWLLVLVHLRNPNSDDEFAKLAYSMLSVEEQCDLVKRTSDPRVGVRYGLREDDGVLVPGEAVRRAAYDVVVGWGKDDFVDFWLSFPPRARHVADLCTLKRFKRASQLAAMARGMDSLLAQGDTEAFLVVYLEDLVKVAPNLYSSALTVTKRWMERRVGG